MGNARDYSTKSCESFAKWDRDSLSWKTFQRSLLEEWETYSEPYPRSGSMQNGKLYRRNQWERDTVATEYSLSVGIPTASMSKRSEAFRKGRLLIPAEAAETWPTPQASDDRDRGCMEDPSIQRRAAIGKQVMLSQAVKEKRGPGTLNPVWVEWLMGFPSGWTNLESDEPPSAWSNVPTVSDASGTQ